MSHSVTQLSEIRDKNTLIMSLKNKRAGGLGEKALKTTNDFFLFLI